jgi:hypothetical protein
VPPARLLDERGRLGVDGADVGFGEALAFGRRVRLVTFGSSTFGTAGSGAGRTVAQAGVSSIGATSTCRTISDGRSLGGPIGALSRSIGRSGTTGSSVGVLSRGDACRVRKGSRPNPRIIDREYVPGRSSSVAKIGRTGWYVQPSCAGGRTLSRSRRASASTTAEAGSERRAGSASDRRARLPVHSDRRVPRRIRGDGAPPGRASAWR